MNRFAELLYERKTIFLVVLILLHVNPHFSLMGGFISAIVVLFYLLLVYSTTKISISREDFIFLFLMFVLLLIHISITPGLDQVFEKIKGAVQLFLGIFVFVLILRLNLFCDTKASMVITGLMLMFAILAFGEVSSETFKVGVDAVRSMLFPDDYLYGSYDRDIDLAGHVRPTLLASEPSHLSKSILLLYAISMSLRSSTYQRIIQVLILPVFLYLLASPILVGVVVLMLYKYLPIKVFFTLMVLAVMASILHVTDSGMGGRLSSVGDLDVISSENIRMVFPAVLAVDVIKNYPLFGVGISNFSSLVEISSLPYPVEFLSGNNSILKLIHFAGVSGIFSLLAFFFFVVRSHGKHNAYYFLVFFILFSFSTGSVFSIYFWASVGLVYSSTFRGVNYVRQ